MFHAYPIYNRLEIHSPILVNKFPVGCTVLAVGYSRGAEHKKCIFGESPTGNRAYERLHTKTQMLSVNVHGVELRGYYMRALQRRE